VTRKLSDEEDEQGRPYDEEPPDDGPGRTRRAAGATAGAAGRVSQGTPPSGLGDPGLAIWLYSAVVITGLMFSKKWVVVRTAISKGLKPS
jgi:hypothetical protein